MNFKNFPAALVVAAAALTLSSAAHAALEGRDLDGNLSTIEAYYDTVLGSTWLADANYAMTSGYDADGRMRWTAANNWAAGLSFTDGVNVYDNWRLPTVEPINGVSFNLAMTYTGSSDMGWNITSPQSELSYMFYVNLSNPGQYSSAGGAATGCYVSASNTCLDNVEPFSNLSGKDWFWTATSTPAWSGLYAFDFDMATGTQSHGGTTLYHYAWAVSDGDVGVAVSAVPETNPWVMFLSGLGLIGMVVNRRISHPAMS